MRQTTTFKYSGSAPGADANTYNIFSSVTAFTGANMAQQNGLKRLVVTVDHPQAGTGKFYRSSDRGVNWVQVGGDFAATASATDVTTFDLLFEGFYDFKLDWLNGGSAQTGWTISIALTSERAAAV